MDQEEKNVYINMTRSRWGLIGLSIALVFALFFYAGWSAAKVELTNSPCREGTIGAWVTYDDGPRYRVCLETGQRPEVRKNGRKAHINPK